MKWLITLMSGLVLGTPQVMAEPFGCEQSEAACVLDAAWSAALLLPEEKRLRLADAFLEIAALSEDQAVLAKWEARFDRSASDMPVYTDYGWQVAEPILNRGGVESLISMAERRADPLNFGRTDVLLSAGKRLHLSDQAAAQRINAAMLSLLGQASKFERPNLAHAAAELAMVRCDAGLMQQALRSTDAPSNLRYAFWKSRIDGDATRLLNQVRSIKTEDDTRDIRRVLDGYRAILEHGYCDGRKSVIGG
ncbi:MAG: hypothetical protein AAFQ15_04800 [Pseudomonadota bacterium]